MNGVLRRDRRQQRERGGVLERPERDRRDQARPLPRREPGRHRRVAPDEDGPGTVGQRRDQGRAQQGVEQPEGLVVVEREHDPVVEGAEPSGRLRTSEAPTSCRKPRSVGSTARQSTCTTAVPLALR